MDKKILIVWNDCIKCKELDQIKSNLQFKIISEDVK